MRRVPPYCQDQEEEQARATQAHTEQSHGAHAHGGYGSHRPIAGNEQGIQIRPRVDRLFHEVGGVLSSEQEIRTVCCSGPAEVYLQVSLI